MKNVLYKFICLAYLYIIGIIHTSDVFVQIGDCECYVELHIVLVRVDEGRDQREPMGVEDDIIKKRRGLDEGRGQRESVGLEDSVNKTL